MVSWCRWSDSWGKAVLSELYKLKRCQHLWVGHCLLVCCFSWSWKLTTTAIKILRNIKFSQQMLLRWRKLLSADKRISNALDSLWVGWEDCSHGVETGEKQRDSSITREAVLVDHYKMLQMQSRCYTRVKLTPLTNVIKNNENYTYSIK